jgi:hypothetical protein
MAASGLEVLTPAQAHTVLARELGGVDLSDVWTLDCVVLRSVLWALTDGVRSVHTLRILNRATALVLALPTSTPDERLVRARLRDSLEELSEVGDAVELGQGLWLPGSLREVELGSHSEHLLVGGLPTGLLPEQLRGTVVHHGASRRVRGEALRHILALPVEPLSSWARAPVESLREWAESLLDTELPPYVPPREGAVLRIYAPERAKHRGSQGKRWVDSAEGLSGRYLAYRTRVFGVREYRIVEVAEGNVVGSGAALLPGEARRLMYALDARAGKAVSVRWEERGGETRVTLWSELPRSEQRLFAALGTLLPNPDDTYYPRVWVFSAHRELVLERLRRLEVQLVGPSP